MICTVCDEDGRGIATEFRLGPTLSCPAMACRACGAILMEEMTDEERESVREAISTRGAVSESPASLEARERETRRPPGPWGHDQAAAAASPHS